MGPSDVGPLWISLIWMLDLPGPDFGPPGPQISLISTDLTPKYDLATPPPNTVGLLPGPPSWHDPGPGISPFLMTFDLPFELPDPDVP